MNDIERVKRAKKIVVQSAYKRGAKDAWEDAGWLMLILAVMVAILA